MGLHIKETAIRANVGGGEEARKDKRGKRKEERGKRQKMLS
jgi:hypothetical protein